MYITSVLPYDYYNLFYKRLGVYYDFYNAVDVPLYVYQMFPILLFSTVLFTYNCVFSLHLFILSNTFFLLYYKNQMLLPIELPPFLTQK